MLPQLTDQARKTLGPDPHLDRVLLDIHPLDEELDDARLLGGEQLVPDDRRAVQSGSRTLDLIG
jgi:hypothetical protein